MRHFSAASWPHSFIECRLRVFSILDNFGFVIRRIEKIKETTKKMQLQFKYCSDLLRLRGDSRFKQKCHGREIMPPDDEAFGEYDALRKAHEVRKSRTDEVLRSSSFLRSGGSSGMRAAYSSAMATAVVLPHHAADGPSSPSSSSSTAHLQGVSSTLSDVSMDDAQSEGGASSNDEP